MWQRAKVIERKAVPELHGRLLWVDTDYEVKGVYTGKLGEEVYHAIEPVEYLVIHIAPERGSKASYTCIKRVWVELLPVFQLHVIEQESNDWMNEPIPTEEQIQEMVLENQMYWDLKKEYSI